MVDPHTAREDVASTTPQLSARGVERREAILGLARRAARARRRHRRAGRAGAAVALVVTLAAVGILARRPAGRPEPAPVAREHVTTPADEAAPTSPRRHPESVPDGRDVTSLPGRPRRAVTVARLATEPGIARRLALRPSPGRRPVPRLSDDELLERLAESGRPAGLAYVDGGATLLLFQGDERRREFR